MFMALLRELHQETGGNVLMSSPCCLMHDDLLLLLPTKPDVSFKSCTELRSVRAMPLVLVLIRTEACDTTQMNTVRHREALGRRV